MILTKTWLSVVHTLIFFCPEQWFSTADQWTGRPTGPRRFFAGT